MPTYAAEAIEACPTETLIVQTPSGVPKTFWVELGTGSYTVFSPDMGLTKSLNGVGFSNLDNYLYGWDYEHGTVGKVGEDYQVELLTIVKDSSAAAAGNFYVGDVAINENVWYGYRKHKGRLMVTITQ